MCRLLWLICASQTLLGNPDVLETSQGWLADAGRGREPFHVIARSVELDDMHQFRADIRGDSVDLLVLMRQGDEAARQIGRPAVLLQMLADVWFNPQPDLLVVIAHGELKRSLGMSRQDAPRVDALEELIARDLAWPDRLQPGTWSIVTVRRDAFDRLPALAGRDTPAPPRRK